jgi:DNA polymerase-3 subunit delta
VIAKGPALSRAIERPDPNCRFYLFHGPDEAGSRALGERLLAALGAEKFALPASTIKADPAVLPDEASALALFGGPRAIWLEPAGDEIAVGIEALLDAARVESPVIAIAGTLRKGSALLKVAEGHAAAIAAISYIPDSRDSARIAFELGRAEGLALSADLADRIAAAAGGNRAVMASEFAKYALYLDASTERPAELTHEIVDLLGADSGERDLSQFADLALDGEPARLFDELDRAAPPASEAVRVVRALQRRLLQLAPIRARIDQGERPDAVLTSLGKSLFWKDKPIVGRLLRWWPAERLATLVERSAVLEKGIMLDGRPPLAALGEELAAIARAARRRR